MDVERFRPGMGAGSVAAGVGGGILVLRAVGILALSAAAACVESEGLPVTVTDSAGVTITINRDDSVPFARVSTEPILSLGGPEAAGPTLFSRIQDIHVDTRGRLWVADGGSGELRIFLPDGSPWKVRGGRGEGPGEFVYIRLLGARSGDSVFMADTDGRIAVYDPEGELARTGRVPSDESPAPRPFSVFADGSVLGQVPRIVMVGDVAPGQVLPDSVDLVRVDLDARARRPYGGARGALWIWTGRNQVPVPFTTNAGFDVGVGEEVHLVSGPSFRIHVFSEGRLEEIYGVDRPPRPVSDEDVAAYRRMAEEWVPEAQRADYLAALESEARPADLPAYARLLVSTQGEVWAQRYEADPAAAPVWDVFDSERRLVGQVTTPASFVVMCITPDAVVGVWRDDVGVEYVRSYAVHD